jgi:hypothetical protein
MESSNEALIKAIRICDKKLTQWGKMRNQAFNKDDDLHRTATQVRDTVLGIRQQIAALMVQK